MKRAIQPHISNHNLGRVRMLAGNAEAHREVLQEVGEGRNQRVRFLWNSVRGDERLTQELDDRGDIGALQQSWLSERGLGGFKLSLVMPRIEDSLGRLQPLQKRHYATYGNVLPVIAHPNPQQLGSGSKHQPINYPGILRAQGNMHPLFLHQPTVETLACQKTPAGEPVMDYNSGERTAQRMMDAQEQYGFAPQVALDLGHLVSTRGVKGGLATLSHDWTLDFASTLAAEGALAGAGRVQLEMQPGFNGQHPKHLKMALEGNLDRTPHGDIIDAIAAGLPDTQSSINVDVEVSAAALNEFKVPYVLGNTILVNALLDGPLAAELSPPFIPHQATY